MKACAAEGLDLPTGSCASSDTGLPLDIERSPSISSCAATGLPRRTGGCGAEGGLANAQPAQPVLAGRSKRFVEDGNAPGRSAKRHKSGSDDIQFVTDNPACATEACGVSAGEPCGPCLSAGNLQSLDDGFGSECSGSVATDGDSCSEGTCFSLPGLFDDVAGDYDCRVLLDADGLAPTPCPVPSCHSPGVDPVFDGECELKDVISILRKSEVGSHLGGGFLQPADGGGRLVGVPSRKIAVGWMVEVASEFKLQPETLFLSTALLDRFLAASNALPRKYLQLACAACMFLATKHEEEMHPSVRSFASVADHCFTGDDLLRMESLVLDMLQFRLHFPTPLTFLNLFQQAVQLPKDVVALATYILELGLLEYAASPFLPSHMAAAALLLAAEQLAAGGAAPTADVLARVSGLGAAALAPCSRTLASCHAYAAALDDRNDPVSAVKDKYRDKARHGVACLPGGLHRA